MRKKIRAVCHYQGALLQSYGVVQGGEGASIHTILAPRRHNGLERTQIIYRERMPPLPLQPSNDLLLVSVHLQRHLPPQVHAHGSSKPSVTGVNSLCFPRQQNHGFTLDTDDLLRPPPYLAARLEQLRDG
jgi:hypothetical protein